MAMILPSAGNAAGENRTSWHVAFVRAALIWRKGHGTMTDPLTMLAATAAVSGLVSTTMTRLVMGRRFGRLNAELSAAATVIDTLRSELDRQGTICQAFIDDARDLTIRLDRTGWPADISPNTEATLGVEAEALITAGLFDFVHPSDAPALRTALAACGTAEPLRRAVCRVRHRDGHYLWMEARCHFLSEAAGVLVMMRDISRQKLVEEHLAEARSRLERLSAHDSLTGLPNRAFFLATADKLVAAGHDVAVLFIDLDRFKPVNDMHGHAVGDAILREVGARLSLLLGQEPIIARLGADEFAAALRVTDGDAAISVTARDIIRVVSEPIRINAMTMDIAVSIGISVAPRDGADAAALLRSADIALAYAKQAGTGCYRFFEARMAEALAQEAELMRELPSAVAEGRIVPYFQPLVRMSDLAIVGFEVLARWEHPEKGVLLPATFLPLAEDMGLSSEMFASLLTGACEASANWTGEIRLALNISPHELLDESLPETVRAILAKTGFDGRRLEIEITENALIDDSRVVRSVLEGLRALGLTVALDDFGTGFSSLYHLRELPFDKVKIDKSFMRALDTDAESARYVAAIIGLCHALGLDMTAEGIEDEPTMQRLRELGCTYGQGYLFGRPVPAEDAGRMATAGVLAALAAD
jgi:diguanylate cyclase (GGDEF)-like protein/PAS domain S-box-containing protein